MSDFARYFRCVIFPADPWPNTLQQCREYRFDVATDRYIGIKDLLQLVGVTIDLYDFSACQQGLVPQIACAFIESGPGLEESSAFEA